MKKQDEGFTLIELLIVIVILGILATIVVFAVRGVTDQGQSSACDATEQTYEVAIEAWYAQSAASKTDNGNTGHPSGADLEDSDLIREYVAAPTDGITITEGNGSTISDTVRVGACV